MKDIKNFESLSSVRIKVSSIDMDFMRYVHRYFSSLPTDSDHFLSLPELNNQYLTTLKKKHDEQLVLDRKRKLSEHRRQREAERRKSVDKISEQFEDSQSATDSDPIFFKML